MFTVSTLAGAHPHDLISNRPIFASPILSGKPPFASFRVKTSTSSSSSVAAAAVAAGEAVVVEEAAAADYFSAVATEKEKLGVLVKPMEKARLMLKLIWMEKNVGITLDQVIPGHGTIPLSPYYFWPRKDAWEELKVLLESKPWISEKQMIILLNQATDIINLWQQCGGDLS